MPAVVTVSVPTNIATVKYWGKRDAGELNLPLNSSASACLHIDDLATTTTVLASPPADAAAAGTDPSAQLWLNGKEESNARLKHVVQLVRERVRAQGDPLNRAGWDLKIASANNFPTAAGLASSASGYAALTYSVAKALGVDLSKDDCSDIARQGSGSAVRSMLPEGGWQAWNAGTAADGSDSRAELLAGAEHWPEMRILVLVVSDARKETPSTSGMQASVATSQKLKVRVAEVVPAAMKNMAESIRDRDFPRFATTTMDESDSFHEVCADTTPPIHYLTDTSRAIIDLVRAYNEKNDLGQPGVAYTYDAGPNAVIYALHNHVPAFLAQVLALFGGKSFAERPEEFLRVSEEVRAAVSAQSGKPVTDASPIATTEDSPLKYILGTRVGPGPTIRSEDLGWEGHLINPKTGILKEGGQ